MYLCVGGFSVHICSHTILISVFNTFGEWFISFNLIRNIILERQPIRYLYTLPKSCGMQRDGTKTKSENEYDFRPHAQV